MGSGPFTWGRGGGAGCTSTTCGSRTSTADSTGAMSSGRNGPRGRAATVEQVFQGMPRYTPGRHRALFGAARDASCAHRRPQARRAAIFRPRALQRAAIGPPATRPKSRSTAMSSWGEMWYPCPRTVLLPMSPTTHTHINRSADAPGRKTGSTAPSPHPPNPAAYEEPDPSGTAL